VVKTYSVPPAIGDMLPVDDLLRWTNLRQFIAGGGLRRVPLGTGPSLMSPVKRPRGEARTGQCWMENTERGCTRRNCPWEHTKKADRRSSHRGGGAARGGARGSGGEGGRGSGGGSAGSGGSGQATDTSTAGRGQGGRGGGGSGTAAGGGSGRRN